MAAEGIGDSLAGAYDEEVPTTRFTVRPQPPPDAAPIDWSKLNQPFGSLQSTNPSPSERVTGGLTDAMIAGGAEPYVANDLAGKLMGLVQSTPLGVPLAAADTIHYKNENNAPGAAMAMAGMIPGAKPAARAVKAAAQEAAPAAKSIGSQLGKISLPTIGPTSDVSLAAPYVTGAKRVLNPGVYKRPDAIAAEAAANVVPEHPALKALFGVNRDDLYQISQQGRRQGNIAAPNIWTPNKPGAVNEASAAVMNPANAQRIIDAMAEAQKYPELIKGMDPWYVMDPAYQQMERLVGPERAAKEYRDFNMSMTPFSAGSNVPTEINRGTAANMMRMRGEYPTFQQWGGLAAEKRGADFPAALRDVKGMMGHGNQANPVERYMQTGQHGYGNDSVKINLYSDASGVPQTGFQTRWAVPDAHFTRALGVPDARTRTTGLNDYMGGTEYRPIGPWYRENVANPLGIEAVPAQARMWGLYAPQTGVDTPVGAGKLELLAKNIWERAKQLGIDPAKLRDDVLTGKGHASILATGGLGALLGGAAMQGNQEQRQ